MPRDAPELSWIRLHATAAELTDDGIPPTEEEVIEALARLSVFDCLKVLGGLGAFLVTEPENQSFDKQRQLVDYYSSDRPELHARLTGLLRQGRIIFFEQQLYHLARLAVLHADERPEDGLDEGRLAGDFLFALFGVTDLFETDFGQGHRPDPDALLSFELRQTAMNHSEARIYQWSFYFELFDRIWPQIEKAPDADEAFRRYCGLTINEYLALGFAISAGFSQDGQDGWPIGRFPSEHWFRRLALPDDALRSFLGQSASSVADLKAAILEEERNAGRTTSLSLAIEKRPVIEGPEGMLYAVDFASFERKATHGIFHILAEGAEGEGLDRETYTTPFGAAFQVWAEGCLRRAEGGKPEPAIFADQEYGTKKHRRATPDVVLRYERQIICFEVVAGALLIKTLTHGDLASFDQDLEKLVFKKAGQLDRRIADIAAGDARSIGLEPDGIGRYWPVIVTSAPFPHRAEAMKAARRGIKSRGLLTGREVGVISIVSAEDLASLESYLESTGDTALEVLVALKHHRRTGDFSLTNFLWERSGSIPPAAHYLEIFEEASTEMLGFLFPDGRAQ
jgi:hypothetical protein